MLLRIDYDYPKRSAQVKFMSLEGEMIVHVMLINYAPDVEFDMYIETKGLFKVYDMYDFQQIRGRVEEARVNLIRHMDNKVVASDVE